MRAHRALLGAFTWLLAAASVPSVVAAAEPEPGDAVPDGTAVPSAVHDGREYLVPALAERPFAIDEGPRRFLHRLSFSPAFGTLGSGPLYAARAAYHPRRWLAWEATIAHNPGQSVHALLHTLDAVVRLPLPGRIQPYGSLGYGMILVFPGEALNAAPVTGNILEAGGGFELYLRNDLALRLGGRYLAVPGTDATSNESVSYEYGEWTAGLSFYRGNPRPPRSQS